MPRIANETSAILADIQSRLEKLVEAARQEGRTDALEEVRALVGGGAALPARKPGRPKGSGSKTTAKKTTKSKKPRKNPWANLTPEQRLARVNAIRVGRGLPPKKADGTATKTAAKPKKTAKKS